MTKVVEVKNLQKHFGKFQALKTLLLQMQEVLVKQLRHWP